MNKVNQVLLAIAVAAVCVPAQVSADWYSCKINLVGAGFRSGYINLSDVSSNPAFSDKWFQLDGGEQGGGVRVISTTGKSQLATALTAVSLGLDIVIYEQSAAGDVYPEIQALYLEAR